jgi:carbamoyltransferase
MGFAAFGQFDEAIAAWLVEENYFGDAWQSKKAFFQQAKARFGYSHNRFIQTDPFIQNVVATFQELFTRGFLDKVAKLQQCVGAEHLYYAGGSALNIVTNARLVEQGWFNSIFVPPCAEDSGLALGAGACLELEKHGKVEVCSPYLNNWGIESYSVVIDPVQIKAVADLMLQGKVVGLCNGFGEVGPRALGNRSLIARADDPKLTRQVSEVHKGREWYRPTAPVMLARYLSDFTGVGAICPLSRYMLRDFEILPQRRQEMAGAVHVNGRARIQTLQTRADNPFLFELLSYLADHHGVKALLNTSFNTQGEPIVHTLEDAMASAKQMRLDAVVLNGVCHAVD